LIILAFISRCVFDRSPPIHCYPGLESSNQANNMRRVGRPKRGSQELEPHWIVHGCNVTKKRKRRESGGAGRISSCFHAQWIPYPTGLSFRSRLLGYRPHFPDGGRTMASLLRRLTSLSFLVNQFLCFSFLLPEKKKTFYRRAAPIPPHSVTQHPPAQERRIGEREPALDAAQYRQHM
jgi:hypothetical protein